MSSTPIGRARQNVAPSEVDVHAPAVDEHEHLVREALVEAAERHLGLRAGGLHDVDAGEAAEELGDLRDAGEADVLLGDDRGRVRRVERALRRPRRGDDGLFEHLLGLEIPRLGPARRAAGVAAPPRAAARRPAAVTGRRPGRRRPRAARNARRHRRACACCDSSSIACCLRMRSSRFCTICATSSRSLGAPSRYFL